MNEKLQAIADALTTQADALNSLAGEFIAGRDRENAQWALGRSQAVEERATEVGNKAKQLAATKK